MAVAVGAGVGFGPSQTTSTGVVRMLSLVPSPIWPSKLSPQHRNTPAVVSAQLWWKPVVTADTPPLRPDTFTGAAHKEPHACPSPNWPKVFWPQHWTPPVAVCAQVWKNPASRATGVPVSPTTSTGTVRSMVLPSPSSPNRLKPQHLTSPAVVSAQVWRPPTAMAATPLVSPVTSTGLLRCVVVPSPTSPVLFQPQHLAPPVVVRAQVWWPPETTAATPPVSPATSVGVVQTTLPQLCPSPNWPFSFFPQHVTAPNMVRAQVWYCPAERATTSLPSPTTAAGMARNASWVPPVPSPSWPHWFRPQHWTPPDIVSAQVCSPPAAMAVTPPVSATTSTGLVRSVVVPSPSWP